MKTSLPIIKPKVLLEGSSLSVVLNPAQWLCDVVCFIKKEKALQVVNWR
jgi:hypothetical protein